MNSALICKIKNPGTLPTGHALGCLPIALMDLHGSSPSRSHFVLLVTSGSSLKQMARVKGEI